MKIKNFISTISKLDCFDSPQVFYIQGDNGFKSFTGGIMTIIMILCIVILPILYFNDYVNNNTPNELSKLDRYRNYTITLNKENFFFAYSFDFPPPFTEGMSFTDYIGAEKILHYGAVNPNLNQFISTSNTFLTNCSNFDLDQFSVSEKLKKTIILNAYCIDFNNTVMNFSESEGESTLEISAYRNDLNIGLDGIPYGYFSKAINFTIFYQSLLSFPSKFSINPIQKEIRSIRKSIYISDTLEFSAKIKTVTTQKQGDLFRDEIFTNNYTYYELGDFVESENAFKNVEGITPQFRRICSYKITLENSNNLKIFVYPTFMQKCSELGGTLNLILTFIQVIFGWARKIEQTKYLIDKCFDLDYILKKNKDKNHGKDSERKDKINKLKDKDNIHKNVSGSKILDDLYFHNEQNNVNNSIISNFNKKKNNNINLYFNIDRDRDKNKNIKNISSYSEIKIDKSFANNSFSPFNLNNNNINNDNSNNNLNFNNINNPNVIKEYLNNNNENKNINVNNIDIINKKYKNNFYIDKNIINNNSEENNNNKNGTIKGIAKDIKNKDIKEKSEKNKTNTRFKELYYIFCKEGKSSYKKIFQFFLGIENLIHWNVEWLSYKFLMINENERIAMKYIDINKMVYIENNIKYEDKNVNQLNSVLNYFNEKKNNFENKIYFQKFENITIKRFDK